VTSTLAPSAAICCTLNDGSTSQSVTGMLLTPAAGTRPMSTGPAVRFAGSVAFTRMRSPASAAMGAVKAPSAPTVAVVVPAVVSLMTSTVSGARPVTALDCAVTVVMPLTAALSVMRPPLMDGPKSNAGRVMIFVSAAT
jgi:hypothetical protein